LLLPPVLVNRALLVIPALVAASGCASHDLSNQDPQSCAEGRTSVPLSVNRDLDLLFVIDDSGSMEDEQVSLANNFHRFVDVLENIEGGLPNIHIGVVSTDVGAGPYDIAGCDGSGDDGRLLASAHGNCQPPGDAFISDIALADGSRVRNYTGDLADTFACIAQLGSSGCGFEQPLEAMKRALDGSNRENDGFLRDDATLMVVIISDEDDCSAADTALFDPNDASLGAPSSFRCFEQGVACSPDAPRTPGAKSDCHPRDSSNLTASVQSYIDFLRGLKADPAMVAVADITGPRDPVDVVTGSGGELNLANACSSSSGVASPSVRLGAFLDGFPARNTHTSICDDDLSDALILIAQTLTKTLGGPCIEGEIDRDPDTEGIQADCTLSQVQWPGTDQQVEQLIPACDDSGTLPCWRLTVDDNNCYDTPTHAALDVERGGETTTNSILTLRCLDSCTLAP